MALTKVSYNMINGAVFNVLDYGAVANGSTDDSTAIQAAFDAVPSTGGSVYFPRGTYLVLSGVTPKSNTLVYGDGVSSEIKTTTASEHIFDFGDGTSRSNIQISNLKFNGTTVSKHCINAYNITNFQFNDLYCLDTGVDGDGIYIRDCTGGLVSHIFCDNTQRQGVSVTKGSNINIEWIDGAASMLNLIDIEPNAGDVITDIAISNIYPSFAIRAVNVEAAADPVTNLSVSNVVSHTINFSGITNGSISNIVCHATDAADEFTVYTCDNVNISNITVVDGSTQTKLKVSAANQVNLTNFSADGSTGTAGTIDVDFLSCTNCNFTNLSVMNGAGVNFRYRGCDYVTFNNIHAESGTYVFYAGNTALLSSNHTTIVNIQGGSCTNGLYFDYACGSVYATGDVSGTTTAIDFGVNFTGTLEIPSLLGVRSTETYGYSAAPVSGTWKRGDIVWNSYPSSGGAPGWMCTVAGTPGTWKAMANLA